VSQPGAVEGGVKKAKREEASSSNDVSSSPVTSMMEKEEDGTAIHNDIFGGYNIISLL